MAVTIHEYNHTKFKLLDLGVTPQAENFYFELLDSNALFDVTNTTKTAVDGAGLYEVYGNGWPQGGVNLANLSVAVVEVSKVVVDADDITVEATTGAIGPASCGLVYLDEYGAATAMTPIWLYEFDSPVTANIGEYFVHQWSVGGILRLGITCP